MSIKDLLFESTDTNASVESRPSLLSLTRATTNLIYTKLVATQPTLTPNAALYGVRYLNPNGEMSFLSGATYTGAFGKSDREKLEELSSSNKDSFVKDDHFLFQDTVVKVLVDKLESTETDLFDLMTELLVSNQVRFVSQAADVNDLEDGEISEGLLRIDKWTANARTRKIKSSVTVELAQDMESNGFDAINTFEDILATEIAEDINKDIQQTLITVSKPFKLFGVDNGVLDLSDITIDTSTTSRKLYHFIAEMNAELQRSTAYNANYVLASTRCAAMLHASGYLTKKKGDGSSDVSAGILNNGLEVFVDTTSPMDYVVVGVSIDSSKESVGSLFYAPYLDTTNNDEEGVGHFKVINDSNSLQPSLLLMLRYALSVNPYTLGLNDEEAKVIDGTDFDKLAGRSMMSIKLGVKLPKLIV